MRIVLLQATLRLFASPPGADWPKLDAVKAFLQAKVDAGLLVVQTGGYKAVPK